MFDKRKFIKTAMLIAMPVVLQNTITMAVNMLDTFMLSSYGEVQLSASSLANGFISIFQILCMGTGSGAAVLTAQYWGSQNLSNLKKTISLMLKMSIALAILFSVTVALLAEPIMYIYSPDPEVVQYGVLYFLWSIPTFILMALTITTSQVLRTMRKVHVPLYASLISMGTNLFANWVFIYGNLGMPEMQIAGAALGTVIARLVECIILSIYFLKIENEINFKVSDMLLDTKVVQAPYIKYSVPVIVSDLLLGIGTSVTSIVIGHIGTNFAAANSIVTMIQRISTVFTQGLGMAAHTLIGNSIGKGEIEIARKQGVILLKLSVFFGLFAGVIIFLFGPTLMLYFSSLNEDTIKIANELLYALSIIVVFQALQSIVTKGILRGGGDTDFCMKMDATFLWVVSIPLGVLTGLVLKLKPFIIMFALHADWIIKTIIGLQRVFSGKWVKSIE